MELLPSSFITRQDNVVFGACGKDIPDPPSLGQFALSSAEPRAICTRLTNTETTYDRVRHFLRTKIVRELETYDSRFKACLLSILFADVKNKDTNL